MLILMLFLLPMAPSSLPASLPTPETVCGAHPPPCAPQDTFCLKCDLHAHYLKTDSLERVVANLNQQLENEALNSKLFEHAAQQASKQAKDAADELARRPVLSPPWYKSFWFGFTAGGITLGGVAFLGAWFGEQAVLKGQAAHPASRR